MNRYQEMHQRQQREFNALPLGFAFSKDQFYEMMREWVLDPRRDLNKIYSIGAGGYVQKKDVGLLHQTRELHDAELAAAIEADDTGEGFVYEMFLYELDNHEYGYTGDLDDTLDALGYTFEEIAANAKLFRGLEKARKEIWERE